MGIVVTQCTFRATRPACPRHETKGVGHNSIYLLLMEAVERDIRVLILPVRRHVIIRDCDYDLHE